MIEATLASIRSKNISSALSAFLTLSFLVGVYEVLVHVKDAMNCFQRNVLRGMM